MALSHAIDLTAAVWLVCRGRRCGPRAVASLASGLYVGPVGTAPGDDVSSSPGAGAGGEVAAPRIKIKSGGGKDAGRLRLFVAGSRRRPPSPEPRARPAAWPSPPPSSFLAQRLPSHHVRSICQRKSCSSLSRPSARACGRPGAEGGRCRYRYHIHWTWTSYWTDIVQAQQHSPGAQQPGDSPIAK